MPRPATVSLLNSLFILTVVLGTVGTACKKDDAQAPAPAPAATPEAPAAKPPAPAVEAPAAAAEPAAEGVALVEVANAGTVLLNGQPSTFDAVKAFLTDEKTKPTQIHYKRDKAEEDPTPEAAPLIHGLLQFMVDSKIPIRMIK